MYMCYWYTINTINIIKNRGSRIDPWGTSALIVRHLAYYCIYSIPITHIHVLETYKKTL
jgi:hypothetical protein